MLSCATCVFVAELLIYKWRKSGSDQMTSPQMQRDMEDEYNRINETIKSTEHQIQDFLLKWNHPGTELECLCFVSEFIL